MFYKDLSNYCYYLKTAVATVRNVGWLEKDKPYTTGGVLDSFLPKLSSIILGNDIVDAQVNRIRSVRPCALSDCGALTIERNGRKDVLGGGGDLGSIKRWQWFFCCAIDDISLCRKAWLFAAK